MKWHLVTSVVLLSLVRAPFALAQDSTPGYPEEVIQWTVEQGETCKVLAETLYGGAAHISLLSRYNLLDCSAPLTPGRVLIVPSEVRSLPPARIDGSTPTVRARPAQGSWSVAENGMPLFRGYGVNTLAGARANILFRDRSRVHLGENTLVVIYGTSGDSALSSSAPLNIELNEGEVRAGIAALSGKPIELRTEGGAQVRTDGTDTVLRTKGTNTTVSVFDGTSSVTSAGAKVDVPKNFGTSFRKAKPPKPPKPLPPAPVWLTETLPPPAAMTSASATLRVSWGEVGVAASYRVEMALDSEFQQTVLRERVPSHVTAFRAEGLAPATYYVRVRAIDSDDFLGISSTVHRVAFIGTKVDLGELDNGTLKVTPYGRVALSGSELEVSVNGGRYSALPRRLDASYPTLETIQVRYEGEEQELELPFKYIMPEVLVTGKWRANGWLHLEISAPEVTELQSRAKFRFRVTQEDSSVEVLAQRITGKVIAGLRLDPHQVASVELVDLLDRVVATASVDPVPTPAPPQEAPDVELPAIGVMNPLHPSAPVAAVSWWQPRPAGRAQVSMVAASDDHGSQLQASGTAVADRYTLSARFSSSLSGEREFANSALETHIQAVQALTPSVDLALRFGALLPVATDSPPTRLDLGLALGGAIGRGYWLGTLNSRLTASHHPDPLPLWQGSLLSGGGYRPIDYINIYGLIESHLLGNGLEPRGALQLGFEAGTWLSGSVVTRWSPWQDVGGRYGLMVGLTIRPD